MESSFVVVDWRSWKLVRKARLSLSAEAQAASMAVDAWGLAKLYWRLLLDPSVDPREDTRGRGAGPCILVVDAKCRYDTGNPDLSP
jgi:hypothetical protein